MSQAMCRDRAAPGEWAEADAGQGLARSLHRRYLLVLSGVAFLVVLDQAVIQPALVRLTFYAPVINVAGRQRMLSQKLTKAALAMRAARSDGEARGRLAELGEAAERWGRAQHGLRYGDAEMSLPGTGTPEIVAAFGRIQPHFAAMHAAALELVRSGPGSPGAERLVGTILENESKYLAEMDAIVGMFEAEARTQLAWLRLSGVMIAGVILSLLGGVWFAVLRPATRVLHRQFAAIREAHHRLEERVEERTRQLSEANVALAREMAERQQAEARGRRLNAQLAHASRVNAIGQLATGLAHELNQPLGAIANYAEGCQVLLERSDLDAGRFHEAMANIARSALRAGRIVRQMRSFVQSKAGEATRVDVNTLVREVAELCQPEARKLSVTMTTELAGGIAPVYADPIQIQQVLVNLIQNGLQAMHECPVEGRRLVVRTGPDGTGVRVEVSDSGKGFDRETAGKMFEPFFTTKPDGLGIGLAISRTIIHDHGGRLDGTSEPGRGAVVGFTLPAAGGEP